MTKKKNEIKYRIEIIETGDDYISRETAYRYRSSGAYTPCESPVEHIIFSLTGAQAESIKYIIENISKTSDEIERLNKIIKDYKDASKKIMEEDSA